MLATLSAVWGLLARPGSCAGKRRPAGASCCSRDPPLAPQLLAVDLVTVLGAMVAFIAVFALTIAACGVPAGGATLIAIGVAAPGVLFAAVGALLSELYADRRHAVAIGGVLIGGAFLLRVAADGSSSLGWLRWASPLGWVENLRPFAGTDLRPLALLLLATAAATVLAFLALERRDFDDGLVRLRAHAHPESWMLHGIGGFTARLERGVTTGWTVGIGAFAFVFGLLSEDTARFAAHTELRRDPAPARRRERLHRAERARLHVHVLRAADRGVHRDPGECGAHRGGDRPSRRAARATGQPPPLAGRAGARHGRQRGTDRAGVRRVRMVGRRVAPCRRRLRRDDMRAGLNCVPATLLLFGLAVLCFGALPRLTTAVSLGSVVVAYLVELVGALVKAPAWVLDLSPFHHVAPVPAAPANTTAAITMIVVGVACAVAGIELFARRDLVGA